MYAQLIMTGSLAPDFRLKVDSADLMARLSSAEARATALERSRDRVDSESAARLRALDAAHQAEVQVMEARISELMDALASGKGGLGFFKAAMTTGAGGGGAAAEVPPGAASELRFRQKSLEALNRQLEAELEAARRRAEEAEEALEGARAAAAAAEKKAVRASEAVAAKAKADRDNTLERYQEDFFSNREIRSWTDSSSPFARLQG